MAFTPTLRDADRENRIFTSRVLACMIIIGLAASLLLGRLAYIQIVRHDHYTTLSRGNRVKILPIPPTRGLIYSREGILLAENRPAFSLEIVPERVIDLEGSLVAVSEIVSLSEADLERFRKALKQKRRFENVPLRFNLSEEEVARFAVNRHRFAGFDIVARLSRSYPLGGLAAHVVGYVGRIDEAELKSIDSSNYSGTTHIGKTGVEKSYEHVLHGQVGYQQVEVNAEGKIRRVLERSPPVPGKDIYLTLDSSLQSVAIEALGDQRGAVVAIDPITGGLLALVSTPVYDPMLFVNGIAPKLYKELRNSPDRPLFNRALKGQYPPGSTVKPFLALAGLELGLRRSSDTSWCPGWFNLPGKRHRFRCWKKIGHGHVNLKQAVAQSCDVYFYGLAWEMGIDRIHDYLGRYGFGRRTGVDLPGEAPGLLPSREWKQAAHQVTWYPGETVITGIGQGYTLVTPLQLALATATLSRNGYLVRPRIVGKVEDPISWESVEVVDPASTAAARTTPSNWQYIIDAMAEVVHGKRGTARRVGEQTGYRFAGKTGTSQLFQIGQDETIDNDEVAEHLRDHALFIAFAPLVDPTIAVAVVVENGGSGSTAAAPVARKLLDHYLDHGQAIVTSANSG